jgi:hypothetical protein
MEGVFAQGTPKYLGNDNIIQVLDNIWHLEI